MADFKTHVTVAAVISAPLAVSAFIFGLADINDTILYGLAGILGGMLPDIDADEAIAIRIVFRLFATLVAGLSLVVWLDKMSYWHLLGLAIASYFLIRFPVQWCFEKLTIHRGVLHSVLANLLFTAVAVPLAYHVFTLNAQTAWGIGGFIFLGATIHLILDELYSVELSGLRVKRSFGTAMKLTDWGQPFTSILFVIGCGVGYWLSPSPDVWIELFRLS